MLGCEPLPSHGVEERLLEATSHADGTFTDPLRKEAPSRDVVEVLVRTIEVDSAYEAQFDAPICRYGAHLERPYTGYGPASAHFVDGETARIWGVAL